LALNLLGQQALHRVLITFTDMAIKLVVLCTWGPLAALQDL
jgi:hypothetical protein